MKKTTSDLADRDDEVQDLKEQVMILKGDLAKKTSEADELIALKKTLEKKLSQRKQGISDLT